MTNRQTLESLMAGGGIDVRRGALFDRSPEAVAPDFDFGCIEGMMLGLAVGDALGIPSGGMLPRTRHIHHGEVRDYLPNRLFGRAPVNSPGAIRPTTRNWPSGLWSS